MAVYVDDFFAPYGRMKMCHMIADTRDELDEMAVRIGVLRKYIQDEGTHREHFDVCMAARSRAVELGAQEITVRELARKCRDRRGGKNPLAVLDRLAQMQFAATIGIRYKIARRRWATITPHEREYWRTLAAKRVHGRAL